MKYDVAMENGYAVVRLQGEVDLHRSPEARKAILGCLQQGHHTLVDLSGVQYIDSSGVASLVEGLQLARDQQLQFGLVAVSEATLNVLKLARLDTVFAIQPDASGFPGPA